MSQPKSLVVTDKDGVRGTIEYVPDSSNPDAPQVLIRLEDGQPVIVPHGALTEGPDGGYYLPISLRNLARARGENSIEEGSEMKEGGEMIMPVIVEELEVGKRKVETGRVRVTKTVRERVEVIDHPLLHEEVDIERVVINKLVDGPVPIRSEGDVTIIPVLEEVLVVEKRLMLKEELHIIKRRFETRDPQSVTLRGEEVTVERINARSQEKRQ
jgi:uncharacterized protein (TIGR02271 family)